MILIWVIVIKDKKEMIGQNDYISFKFGGILIIQNLMD